MSINIGFAVYFPIFVGRFKGAIDEVNRLCGISIWQNS
jgi:hypothetical protein